MAASDYEVRTKGTACPIGYLASAIGPSDTVISISSFMDVEGIASDLVIGMGLLINGEIMRLDSNTLPDLTVARGCADTIPSTTQHAAGSIVWFFSRDLASDNREYAATETVGVKLLPYTNSGGSVPISYAEPHTLNFNWRHARPYPPGNFMCNAQPWHAGVRYINPSDVALTFTWAHRDRITQADQLVGHSESSVGPEVGTTYVARVYDAFDNQVREVTGIVGTTWDYTRTMALMDIVDGAAYIDIYSVRDTLESWQGYRTNIYVVGDQTRVTETYDVRVAEDGQLRNQE